MNTYRCVKRYRDSAGKITGYLLEDESGGQIKAHPNDMKFLLSKSPSALIVNLKLTSDGRIIKNSIFEDKSIHSNETKAIPLNERRSQLQGHSILKIFIDAYRISRCLYLVDDLYAKEVREQVWDSALTLRTTDGLLYTFKIIANEKNSTYELVGMDKTITLNNKDEATSLIARSLASMPTTRRSPCVSKLLYESDDTKSKRNLKLITLGDRVICVGVSNKAITELQLPLYVDIITNLALYGCDKLKVIGCTPYQKRQVERAIVYNKLDCATRLTL